MIPHFVTFMHFLSLSYCTHWAKMLQRLHSLAGRHLRRKKALRKVSAKRETQGPKFKWEWKKAAILAYFMNECTSEWHGSETEEEIFLWVMNSSLPLKLATVDSAYNIHGYKGQPVIVATNILSQNSLYRALNRRIYGPLVIVAT